jgi:hypothetical protein
MAPLGPLPAGTYTSVVFVPPVTFTTDGEMILRGERADTVWLEPEFAADAEFNVIVPDEVGVVDRLARDDRITRSQPFDLTVAGRPARGIEIEAAADAYGYGDRTDFVPGAVIVGQAAEWYFYLHPGARARVIELAVGDRPILIFYEAPAADFDRLAPIAQALVESLRFDGPS